MISRPKRSRRLSRGLVVVGLIVVLAALPIVWTETVCVGARGPGGSAFASVLDPAARRDEINSYLSYPEWSIVHAYEDLAAVIRQGSESDYAYFSAIGSYWRSLCSITGLVSSRGTISGEYRLMLYVIGLSFAAEMGLKGLWEETIGLVAVVLRGGRRTPEDEYALAVADEYAAFLRQNAWYEFPFGARLVGFWRETPLWGGSVVRKVERRVAMTLEWSAKAAYAQVIGFGAAATMTFQPRTQAVVDRIGPADMAADPRIKLVRTLDDGTAVIEADRYRTMTDVMRGLALRGHDFREIAGNANVLVTVQVPHSEALDLAGAQVLLKVPIQGQKGASRFGLDVKVAALADLMRRVEDSKVVLEHVYDY